MPRAANNAALAQLRDFLIILKNEVTSKGATLVLVDDIPKPCGNNIPWPAIYASGKYQLCQTTVIASKKDRASLTKLYQSMLQSNVLIFDPHDYLCFGEICGIYDAVSKSLLYGDNSPHFTPNNPAPLTEEWKQFLRGVVKKAAIAP